MLNQQEYLTLRGHTAPVQGSMEFQMVKVSSQPVVTQQRRHGTRPGSRTVFPISHGHTDFVYSAS